MSIKSLKNKFINGEYNGRSFTYIFSKEGAFTLKSKKGLKEALNLLCEQDFIYITKGVYKLSKKSQVTYSSKNDLEIKQGVFRANERGFGFVTTTDGDYFCSPNDSLNALNQDEVEIAITFGKRGVNDSCVITKVIKRGITKLTGYLFNEGAYTYMRPDDSKYLCDILITDNNGYQVEIGDKVFVEITTFPKKGGTPYGKIIAKLGRQFEFSAEELSVLCTHGFSEPFSDEVKNEARKLGDTVDKKELFDRVDLTKEVIFTIDGESARDFDDAVSLEKKGNNYYLGVHIADVSHYVKYNGIIDKEAFKRGTSGYFPDRVVPMLPEELSNGLCSLNEGVIRLTLSVFIEINNSGEIVDRKIVKSYIKSKHRMTYTAVQNMIDGDKDTIEKYSDIYPIIMDMLALKNILEKRRKNEGYINLDVKEADIDIVGDKIEISLHKSNDATNIIEQFMITANEVVAEYLYYLDLPCVYRVHEKPEDRKVESFKNFLNALGIKVMWNKDCVYPLDYQKLLERLQGQDKFSVVNRVMLRSLQKAKYSTANIGHFGLASKCYCHFTSPIRRYPDLTVHRVLKDSLDGNIVEINDIYDEFCDKSANNSSERERHAVEAERAVDDLYKVKFMEDKVGEIFDGVISGVINRGLFVELENTCEGFVPIELLPKGSYEYVEREYALKSKKHTYKMGDSVKIQVLGVDIGNKKVEFGIILEKTVAKK